MTHAAKDCAGNNDYTGKNKTCSHSALPPEYSLTYIISLYCCKINKNMNFCKKSIKKSFCIYYSYALFTEKSLKMSLHRLII